MAQILVTGFGSFGNVKLNPSARLIEELTKRHPETATHVFVSTYLAIEKDLSKLLDQTKPEIVIMFGVANRSGLIRLERKAKRPRNAMNNGAEWYTSTLPLEKIRVGLDRSGIKSVYSDSAGNYLCNYLFYRVGQLANKFGIKQYGFIHIPNLEKYQLQTNSALDLVSLGETIIKSW